MHPIPVGRRAGQRLRAHKDEKRYTTLAFPMRRFGVVDSLAPALPCTALGFCFLLGSTDRLLRTLDERALSRRSEYAAEYNKRNRNGRTQLTRERTRRDRGSQRYKLNQWMQREGRRSAETIMRQLCVASARSPCVVNRNQPPGALVFTISDAVCARLFAGRAPRGADSVRDEIIKRPRLLRFSSCLRSIAFDWLRHKMALCRRIADSHPSIGDSFRRRVISLPFKWKRARTPTQQLSLRPGLPVITHPPSYSTD